MAIVNSIKRFLGKVKENYGYYKLGRRAEFDEENKRMKQDAINRGLYDPNKEERMRRKIQRGEPI